MGCGGSKSTVGVTPLTAEEPNHKNGVLNGDTNKTSPKINSNGSTNLDGTLETKVLKQNQLEKNTRNKQVKQQEVQNSTQYGDKEKTAPLNASKGVSFNVALDANGNTDKLATSMRRPPHKLQRLESAPKLTSEMLDQKIAVAEENRQRELDKRAKRTSKRRKELLEAREIDKAQQQMTELEQKQLAYNKNRSKSQAQIVAKQQQREERAKRVQHKAQRFKDSQDPVPVMIDPDETYNADETEDELWEDSSRVSPEDNFKKVSPEPSDNRSHSPLR